MNESIKACASAAIALAEIRAKKFQPIPKDWFTLNQLMDHFGRGKTFARDAINELVTAGKLEAQKWLVLGKSGQAQQITIYKTK